MRRDMVDRSRVARTVLVLFDVRGAGPAPEPVRDISRALAEGGAQATAFGVKDDFDALVAEVRRVRPDIVVNLVERFAGSPRLAPDVAAALELIGVPFTGAGPVGLYLGSDPHLAFRVLGAHGLSIAAGPAAGPEITFGMVGNEQIDLFPPAAGGSLDERASDLGRAAFSVLGLRDYATMTLRVVPARSPAVVRIEANPPLGPTDDLARSASRAGLVYPALVRRIMAEALARHEAAVRAETLLVE